MLQLFRSHNKAPIKVKRMQDAMMTDNGIRYVEEAFGVELLEPSEKVKYIARKAADGVWSEAKDIIAKYLSNMISGG